MKEKLLHALLDIRMGEGHCKMWFAATGKGKSHDLAHDSAWRLVKRSVSEQFPGATYRVRALHYEVVR